MELKDLTPWITISITLAISILVPLFTQIANNRHHRKMQQEKLKHEEVNQRITAYKDFLMNVGGAIEYRNAEALRAAGSSIGHLYLYLSDDLHHRLNRLFNNIRKSNWEEAENEYFEIAKLISIEKKIST